MAVDVDVLREAILSCVPTTEKQDLAARSLDELKEEYGSLRRYERAALALLPPQGWDWAGCEPRIIGVAKSVTPLWRYLRKTVSRAPYPGHPGRVQKYWVMDRGKVVGVVELADGTLVNAARERWVGWSAAERGLRRRYIPDMSTCVPITPFGLLTGGKCMALLVATRTIADDWFATYRSHIAAILTTSLFGKSSQYNKARGWEFVGLTDGIASSHITATVKRMVWQYARERELRGIKDRNKGGTIGNAFSLMGEVFRDIGASPPQGQPVQRGTYVAPLHDNAREWLRDGFSELAGTVWSANDASAYWQARWRDMRYPKKRDELGEYSPDDYRIKRVMADLEDSIVRTPDRGTVANDGRLCEPDPSAPDMRPPTTGD